MPQQFTKPGMFANMTPDQLKAAAASYGWELDDSGAKAAPRQPSVADQQTMADIGADYKTAAANNAYANDFARRNEQTDTGDILGTNWGQMLSQMVGRRGYENYPIMNMESIALAAGNKPEAIKRLTQSEVGWLRGGAPSIGNPRASNAEFQKYYGQRYVQAAAKKSFYDSFLRTKGSLDGADDAWNRFASQRFDQQGNYIRPDRGQMNAALKAQSKAATSGPTLLGME